MNKISEFFKMYSEVSFSSSLNVEDAISAVRENTNLKPDMYLKKAERDKYLFIAHDKVHPSLNEIIPNMPVYGQKSSLLTPVLSIEFYSNGASDQTMVKIKARPDPNTFSIWIFLDVIVVLLGLINGLIAVFSKDYIFIFGFVFCLAWVSCAKLFGFWMPYKSVLNDLKALLKYEDNI